MSAAASATVAAAVDFVVAVPGICVGIVLVAAVVVGVMCQTFFPEKVFKNFLYFYVKLFAPKLLHLLLVKFPLVCSSSRAPRA